MSRIDPSSHEEFNKAFAKAKFQTLLSKIQMERTDLLSFYDIKDLIKPKRQNYLGTKPIPVKGIIGSEGRYNDFTNLFYPKKHLLRDRWASISSAHSRMIDLPSISVFKLGNAYFVRDGNHRVSVAKAIGVEFIDADIVELDSEIELKPGMTDRQIRDEVVAYERQQVFEGTGIGRIHDMREISFTAPGQYTEMLHHIDVHKYYINMDKEEEISFEEAAGSWYLNVYKPVAEAVIDENLQKKYPGRTVSDIYMWVIKHYNGLKHDYGDSVSLHDASVDFAEKHRLSLWEWVRAWLGKKPNK